MSEKNETNVKEKVTNVKKVTKKGQNCQKKET